MTLTLSYVSWLTVSDVTKGVQSRPRPLQTCHGCAILEISMRLFYSLLLPPNHNFGLSDLKLKKRYRVRLSLTAQDLAVPPEQKTPHYHGVAAQPCCSLSFFLFFFFFFSTSQALWSIVTCKNMANGDFGNATPDLPTWHAPPSCIDP